MCWWIHHLHLVYITSETCGGTPAVNQTGVGNTCQLLSANGVTFYAEVDCGASGSTVAAASLSVVAVLCASVLYLGGM